MELRPFHLAFPVHNLEAARVFYSDLLGCATGRQSNFWIDFNFFGNQITAHLDKSRTGDAVQCTNEVDSKTIPVPHFGAILNWDRFHVLAERFQEAGIQFIHEPMIRFQGEVGEQATMFLKDPSGNVLEFKSFKDESLVFAS